MKKIFILFSLVLLLVLAGCSKTDDNGTQEAVIRAHFRDLFDKSITNEVYAEKYFAPDLREEAISSRNDTFTAGVYKDYPRKIEVTRLLKINENRYESYHNLHIIYEDGTVGTSERSFAINLIQIEGKWFINSRFRY